MPPEGTCFHVQSTRNEHIPRLFRPSDSIVACSQLHGRVKRHLPARVASKTLLLRQSGSRYVSAVTQSSGAASGRPLPPRTSSQIRPAVARSTGLRAMKVWISRPSGATEGPKEVGAWRGRGRGRERNSQQGRGCPRKRGIRHGPIFDLAGGHSAGRPHQERNCSVVEVRRSVAGLKSNTVHHAGLYCFSNDKSIE